MSLPPPIARRFLTLVVAVAALALQGCADPGPCAVDNGGCDEQAECTGADDGTRTCRCPAGLAGDGLVCTEIPANPCATANGGCSADATCSVQSNGARVCACLAGFEGDGITCTPVDPCEETDTCGGTEEWSSLAAGALHSCAVRGDGTLWCWGRNNRGQLGLGDDDSRNKPTRVGDGANWQLVTGGSDHSCGLQRDGTLWCWGHNAFGQLGTGGTTASASPVEIPSGSETHKWSAVTAGDNHTCALREEGSLWCWGVNSYGRLGNGTVESALSPLRIGSATNWTQVSAGSLHTCGVQSDGGVWCWGANYSYELGMNGSTSDPVLAPTRLSGNATWSEVVAGTGGTCAVTSARGLSCWGDVGQSEPDPAPVAIDGTTAWDRVALGFGWVCATRTDGSLWCWGQGVGGQLGHGNEDNVEGPARVGTESGWSDVDAGTNHSCGIRDGRIFCWGDNSSGQLGDGTNVARMAPVEVVF